MRTAPSSESVVANCLAARRQAASPPALDRTAFAATCHAWHPASRCLLESGRTRLYPTRSAWPTGQCPRATETPHGQSACGMARCRFCRTTGSGPCLPGVERRICTEGRGWRCAAMQSMNDAVRGMRDSQWPPGPHTAPFPPRPIPAGATLTLAAASAALTARVYGVAHRCASSDQQRATLCSAPTTSSSLAAPEPARGGGAAPGCATPARASATSAAARVPVRCRPARMHRHRPASVRRHASLDHQQRTTIVYRLHDDRAIVRGIDALAEQRLAADVLARGRSSRQRSLHHCCRRSCRRSAARH